MVEHPFKQFLKDFIPTVAGKSRQLNQAFWILETTGSPDAASLKADLDTELRLLFNDRQTYEKLLLWDKDPSLRDPLLKRELNVLIRAFKQNQIPKKLLQEIAEKEAALSQSYANFRPKIGGKELSDNDIRELLKREKDPAKRKQAWQASKEIGTVLAPQILHLVALRNESAKSLGYTDYFQMQLDLQEVDRDWLEKTFEDLASRSAEAYSQVVDQIEKWQCRRFGVSVEDLGPWAWSEPFGQEDPVGTQELDALASGLDLCVAGKRFYDQMGIDVGAVLERSDMYERPGKNQHAFCINIDRVGDVRTLNNIKDTIKWLETVLHELGHAIYDLGFDKNLPWLLREPPHMITTEAMALIAGRQAYREAPLKSLIGREDPLMQQAEESLKRRQLIFSRWVLVMTHFESELYRNPHQNLDALWWDSVEKYQKIKPPEHRNQHTWASKYHLGLAPVYYFSYLLGEMLASMLEVAGADPLNTPEAGRFLSDKLFHPGNRMSWFELVRHATGKPLTPDAWIHQFARG